MKKRVFLFVIVLFFGCQKLKDADFGRELEVIKKEYGVEYLLSKHSANSYIFETLEGIEAKSHLPLVKFIQFENKNLSRENRNIKERFEIFNRHKYDLRKNNNQGLIDSIKVFSIIQVLKSKIEKSKLYNKVHFSKTINNLSGIPVYFSSAKSMIRNPSKEKLEYAILTYSKDYFYLKNNLPLLIRKSSFLRENQIDFSKKNKEAQLAVKDFIAFLNSQLFELGE